MLRSSIDTHVLVIGAGPAGCAAARALAQRGLRVLLVDRQRAPRDKVCGDALIPDSLDALDKLGLLERVAAEAQRVQAMRLYAPSGAFIELAARIACLPRLRLDLILRDAAEEAGATVLAPWRAVAPIEAQGGVGGATFAGSDNGATLDVRARFTVLATGAASSDVLQTFSMCVRKQASAMAARVYVRAPEALARAHPHLAISYDREICPGYGWIFPLPGNVFNIGVGYFNDLGARPPTLNLRRLLARFVATFSPARALMDSGERLTDVRGAPLRTALGGAHLARKGLLVAGEAAGFTYSFSGEGIGKSMASGIIAAETIAAAVATDSDPSARYAARIEAEFAPRFRAYAIAQKWLAHPAMLQFLVRRATAGRYVRQRLQDLVTETADPSELFSLTGLLKASVL
jgi:geranylgeranyl reductase family protein